MAYVDGFVLAVPTANKEEYLEFARKCAPVFKEHGALQMMENWGDDVPDGEVTSLPTAVKRKPDETVVFSWIIWPSKQVRDEGVKKAMEDPRLAQYNDGIPFDGKRMIFGGFETIFEMK